MFVVAILALWSRGDDATADELLRLEAGNHHRKGTPVQWVLPESAQGIDRLQLTEVDGDSTLPVQWIDRSRRLAAIVLPGLPRKTSRNYRLTSARTASTSPACEARQESGAITLLVRGQPVLKYHTTTVQPPDGVDPVFARSGYIHPVWTPKGKIVTSEFPADHYHQHGLFAAWVNTIFEGRKIDFWNQAARTGNVEHVRAISVTSGEVFCEFVVELRHMDLMAPGGPQPVLQEFWTVRAWNVDEGFLVDVESRQTCVADSPLILNPYHYGGMAFRGSDQWLINPRDREKTGVPPVDGVPSRFVTSEGKGRIDGNHTRPRWILASGEIDGTPASFGMMGHPENFRAPEPVRLHPDKPYFVFTPVALGEHRLEPGVGQIARYRFLVTDGGEETERMDRVWHDYSSPVAVETP